MKNKNKEKNNFFQKKKSLIIDGFLLFFSVFALAFSFFLYFPDFFRVIPRLEKIENVGLSEPIVINFSFPVQKNSYVGKIKLAPDVKASFFWQENGRKLVIVPDDGWNPEKEYEVIFPSGKSLIFTKVDQFSLNFSSEKYPEVESFSPKNGAKDILLDIEDPMKVLFDKPIKGFSFKISLDPLAEVIYQNGLSQEEIQILPQKELVQGKKYLVKVLVKGENEKDDKFKEIYRSEFETLPPAPEIWDKNLNLRLEQAKRYTRAKITSGKYIDINLSAQIMSIFEEGKLLDSFIVSSGKRGMETPRGQFSIHNKARRVWSKKYGLWMPYWMAVASDGSFGIHELPEWPGGYKEGQNHLGIPVSHGCIRLGIGSAERVYNFSEIGTPVVIY